MPEGLGGVCCEHQLHGLVAQALCVWRGRIDCGTEAAAQAVGFDACQQAHVVRLWGIPASCCAACHTVGQLAAYCMRCALCLIRCCCCTGHVGAAAARVAAAAVALNLGAGPAATCACCCSLLALLLLLLLRFVHLIDHIWLYLVLRGKLDEAHVGGASGQRQLQPAAQADAHTGGGGIKGGRACVA